MKNRERFVRTLNFEKVEDRLPMIEWADWWDKTLDRWHGEGLRSDLGTEELREYLGLDMVRQFWLRPYKKTFWEARKVIKIHGMDDYKRLKEHIHVENLIEGLRARLLSLKEIHDRGDAVVWMTLEGFFWFPRELMGIEEHMYAFYDYPEVMHAINEDLCEYNIRLVEEFCSILRPDFMTFAEDMSYNLGPMLSHTLFKEFLLPYYNKIIPVIKKYGITPIVDSDGNVESMVPWLIEAGIEGILPLERQAGTDLAEIRRKYPNFKMIGGYDKMVMDKGEEAMRREFERLLPVMKSGGYIPSCDHQTPPAVSLEDYRLYLRLLEEYCRKAVE